MGKGDTIILDKLCHACLIDAAKLSGATIRVFPHNNLERLEEILKKTSESATGSTRTLVVTESVFSMDGDLCPLWELVALKEKYGLSSSSMKLTPSAFWGSGASASPKN